MTVVGAGIVGVCCALHHRLADNTPATRWLGDEPSLFLYPTRAAFDVEAYVWELRRASGVRFERIDAETLRTLEPALSDRYRLAAVLQDHGRAVDPARLAAQLGDRVPLESEGGYHVTLTDPNVELHHPLLDSHAKVAVAPMASGIRIGGMVEFGGIRDDVPPRRRELLLKLIRRILPGIRTEHYTEWRGNRPSLPDSLPVIGRASRVANVYYAFGHQHVGLSSGPKTGRLIAQLLAGEPPAINLAPFRVERF